MELAVKVGIARWKMTKITPFIGKQRELVHTPMKYKVIRINMFDTRSEKFQIYNWKLYIVPKNK